MYGELNVTWDDRETASELISDAAPSRGWRLEGFVGRAEGLADDPTRYLRYGVDAARYLDLLAGDRTLILRVYVEAVAGDAVSFVDLPRLGGPLLLRGFFEGRYRDNALTVASVEYMYPLNEFASAFVFVDSGRVWRSLRDVRFKNIRYGVGGGVQLHLQRAFLARLQVAGSSDGVFFLLGLDPAFERAPRTVW